MICYKSQPRSRYNMSDCSRDCYCSRDRRLLPCRSNTLKLKINLSVKHVSLYIIIENIINRGASVLPALYSAVNYFDRAAMEVPCDMVGTPITWHGKGPRDPSHIHV